MVLEIGKKNKEDELNATIGELRHNSAALAEKLSREESDKLVCLIDFINSMNLFILSSVLSKFSNHEMCRTRLNVLLEKKTRELLRKI